MSRKTFWTRFFISVLIGLAAGAVGILLLDMPGIVVATVLILLVLVTIWSIGRLHDVGLSGAWVLLNLLPILGSLVLFVLLALPAGRFDHYKGDRADDQ